MINFFRKTRVKLADDNKPIKYMRFAFGEILLVVVGILIALSIDNWNEERKEGIIEIQFLKSIKNDLISDTIYFNRRIKESEELINSHYQYIHNAYEEQKDSKEFKELIDLLSFNAENFASQNSTFIEILNSGQLPIFKNSQLKEDFISLYNDYEIASNHIKGYNENTRAQLTNSPLSSIILLKYWKYCSYIFDEAYFFNDAEWRYINDPGTQEFKHYLKLATVYSLKHKDFLYSFKNLQIKVKLLIIDIERELENRN